MNSKILLTFCLVCLTAFLPAAQRPNIILIMGDDMGISDLGCYGSEIETPVLDQLAESGLRFTQFYNTARCCPTRASLLSGLYPHQAGIGWMMTDRGHPGYQGELNRECVTIAEALKTAGYGTYMAGKWHVTKHVSPEGPKDNWPMQRGFDRFYGTIHGAGSLWDPNSLTRDNTQIAPDSDPEYQPEKDWFYTDAIADQTVRYINEHLAAKPNAPFFCYVSFTAAHWPMHARPETIAKYKGKYDAGYKVIRQARFQKMKELGIIKKDSILSPQAWQWGSVQEEEWEIRCMEVYAAMVDEMDEAIGKIVSSVKKGGQLDNTLIFFLQDNGGCAEAYGRRGKFKPRAEKPTLPPMKKGELQTRMQPVQTRDGYPVRTGAGVMPGPADTYIGYGMGWANVSNTPFREYKHWVHEGGISTPLIAHWPAGIKRRGQLEHQPGHLIDIMATCVELGKVNYPNQFNGKKIKPLEGRSLVTAFNGNTIKRDAIFWEHEGNIAIRKGEWKLVAKENQPWELYNIAKDRTEVHDLAKDKPALVKQLSNEFQAYADRANVSPVGTWRGKPRGKKTSKKEFFQLKEGERLTQEEAPNIAGRGILLEGVVKSRDTDGVIIAQGGDAHGFALILENMHLCYLTCVNGKVSTVRSRSPLDSASFQFRCEMNSTGNVKLQVNGIQIASGKVLPTSSMPIDGLAVSSDPGGTVGDYESEHPLDGNVRMTLKLLPKSKKSAINNSSNQILTKEKSANPLSSIKDLPGLPRVLLIGDSISIGYTLPVRSLLKGKANVHRPPTNCASTKHGLAAIEEWLGDGKWDVIHFNWGLHDLKYMGPNGENLADPKNSANTQQVPIKQYSENLKKLVNRLNQTGAKLIWRNTTPVPIGAKGRVPGDAIKYNAAAALVMSENRIPTDDLYQFSKMRWEKIGRKSNVHFTAEGSRLLAEQVAKTILAQLE